jgi:DNA-directed RNA polymerase specialized sigma24 family protein
MPRPTASRPGVQAVSEWLASPYLARVAARVAYQYNLPSQEVPELLQELRIALWKAGLATAVNATWILHTAQHKGSDLLRMMRERGREVSFSGDSSIPGNHPDPELMRLLRARAAMLPPRLKEFYFLRYRAGLSERQIADRLGLCRGSIRCLERRCVRSVKGRLAPGFSHPPAAGVR